MSIKKEKRLSNIINLLENHNQMQIQDLADFFSVSEMTIRRDIKTLVENNIVSNIRGTIIINKKDENNYFVVKQESIHDIEKERIAKEAATLIEPGDSIIVDVGTTTSKIIKFIPFKHPITLICFTVNTLFDALKKNFERLFFGGGIYHPHSQMFESTGIDAFLDNLRASKYFMSAAGISETLGITCVNQYEVKTKQSSLEHSSLKILLADSTKFGKVRSGYITELSEIDIIISDVNLSQEWIDIIKSHNIDLRLV